MKNALYKCTTLLLLFLLLNASRANPRTIFFCVQTELVDSMKRKINELRSQQEEIADEIKANEELGEKITKVVESYTTRPEFSKYQLFTGELNKIIGLLLSLTQRMHRYELMLQDLDMSEESDRIQRVRLVHDNTMYII